MPEIKQKTLVNFVLDETGSMGSIKDQTISGFNEYLATLKRYGKLARMTFTKFNSVRTEVVCANTPVKDVPGLTQENYRPAEMTPLYDAIFASIRATEEAMQKSSEKLAVLCVIMTDGLENASRQHNRQEVFDLIQQKQNEGWTFLYLGANQDAWDVGQRMSMVQGNIHGFAATPVGAVDAFAHSLAATHSFMAMAATGDFQRQGSMAPSTLMADVAQADLAKYTARINKRLGKGVKTKWQR